MISEQTRVCSCEISGEPFSRGSWSRLRTKVCSETNRFRDMTSEQTKSWFGVVIFVIFSPNQASSPNQAVWESGGRGGDVAVCTAARGCREPGLRGVACKRTAGAGEPDPQRRSRYAESCSGVAVALPLRAATDAREGGSSGLAATVARAVTRCCPGVAHRQGHGSLVEEAARGATPCRRRAGARCIG